MKRIMFISSALPINGLFEDLAPALVSEGYKITVCTTDRNYRKALKSSVANEITKIRIPAIKPGTKNIFTRGVNLFIFSIMTFCISILRTKKEISFYGSQPPFIIIVAYLAKVLAGRKYICLVNDLYPHILAKYSLINENSILYQFLLRLTLKSLNNSEKVFVIGRCMRELLENEGISSDKLQFIPNWCDEEKIKLKDQQLVIKRLSKYMEPNYLHQKKFCILYSGNMGRVHNFEFIIDIAQSLRDDPDIYFLFVGDGVRAKEIKKTCLIRKLDNVIFIPAVEYDDLSYILSISPVHYITLSEEFTGLVVPSKFYSSLAVGSEVVFFGAKNCEIARIIKERDIGIACVKSDLTQAIKYLQHRKDLWLSNEYNRRATSEKLKTLYSKKISVAGYLDEIRKIST